MAQPSSDAATVPVDPALADIAHLPDVQSILEVCAHVTGMGYTVVAHVTDDRWLACAVRDDVAFGLPVGGELPVETTLCSEVRDCREVIAFDHASADPRWSGHHTPLTYGLESYIAVPIILSNDEFFGTLCSIDAKPAPASAPATIKMFELFAKLIASQIERSRRLVQSEADLSDARETAQLRDQFIAVLGHDLRNPLAAVEAGASLLERRVGAEHRPLLADMRRSTERMGRLINDVLDFARGRLGGGIIVSRRRVDLSEALAHAVEEMRTANPTREISAAIAPGMRVVCDPDRIGQLVSNLLSNALTHGDPTAPVHLTADQGEGEFELWVANRGRPIAEAIRPRLFQPFNRQVEGKVREGLGLGLYICSQIAAAHHGVLLVASDAAETRFTFRMPLAPANDA